MEINYLSQHLRDQDYKELCEQLYYFTDHLVEDYPHHKSWFFEKQLNGIGTNREIIYFTFHRNICGVAFLKKDSEEKKICTFYVAEHSRNHGVGNLLLEECFKYLQTTKPLISVPKYKIRYFLYYMYRHDWKITQILQQFYNKNNDEVVFNGILK